MALETLVRLCTRDDNLDLILATRPFKRQQKIVKLLFENVQQVNYMSDISTRHWTAPGSVRVFLVGEKSFEWA